jgi:hypothetical protein
MEMAHSDDGAFGWLPLRLLGIGVVGVSWRCGEAFGRAADGKIA